MKIEKTFPAESHGMYQWIVQKSIRSLSEKSLDLIILRFFSTFGDVFSIVSLDRCSLEILIIFP